MNVAVFYLIWGLFVSVYGRLTPRQVVQLDNELSFLIHEKKCAPILIRLAWHDSGTFDKSSNTGGPRAAMRFTDDGGESKHGANAGLDIARKLLLPIQEKWCKDDELSIADLWTFAGTVAIRISGGPNIPFRFGRKDAKSISQCVEEGRLPDGDKGLTHLRKVFYKMGFNDREIVALSGAHTLGSCHSDRSGFDGPWTKNPYVFDNQYFKDIINKKWVRTTVDTTGNPQLHTDPDDGTMMLLSDLALYEEEDTRPIVEEYANSQKKFFADFAKAWQKLVELGYSDDQLYSVTDTAKSEL